MIKRNVPKNTRGTRFIGQARELIGGSYEKAGRMRVYLVVYG
jgi:hypothetical protein